MGGSLRPRSDSQVAVDAMLPILLGYKEKDEVVENVINLWGNARQRSKKRRFNSSPSEAPTAVSAVSSVSAVSGRKGLVSGFKRSTSHDAERRRSKEKDSRRISWPDEVREEGGVRKNSIATTTTTMGRLHQTHSSEPEMKEPQLEI